MKYSNSLGRINRQVSIYIDSLKNLPSSPDQMSLEDLVELEKLTVCVEELLNLLESRLQRGK